MLYISLQVIYVVLAVLIAPVLDSLERKIKAKIHSRIGPPILQTWYDLRKLFNKELVLSRAALPLVLIVLTMLGLCVLTLLAIPAGIPFAFFSGLDIPFLVVLIASIQGLIIAASVVSDNVYAVIGGFREFAIGIVNEVALITAVILIFVSTGLTSFAMLPEAAIRPSYIPVLVLLLTSAYVASGRIPFDIGEAEPELASGILIELSGPALGTALYSILMKRFVCASLSALALVLPLVRLLNPLASFAVFTALTTVMWIIHGIIAVLLGRSRVDIAAKALVLTYSILIISSTALVGVGL